MISALRVGAQGKRDRARRTRNSVAPRTLGSRTGPRGSTRALPYDVRGAAYAVFHRGRSHPFRTPPRRRRTDHRERETLGRPSEPKPQKREREGNHNAISTHFGSASSIEQKGESSEQGKGSQNLLNQEAPTSSSLLQRSRERGSVILATFGGVPPQRTHDTHDANAHARVQQQHAFGGAPSSRDAATASSRAPPAPPLGCGGSGASLWL